MTASTFVYACGGFVLLILVLLAYGFGPYQMVQLIPQFLGVTVFVLVQIALITLCGLVVARIAARMVSRSMLVQIAELEEGSRAIANGELSRRVRIVTDDELGRLAERFNDLSARLDAADRQRRAFVANISHDLRTPIAIVKGHLEAQIGPNQASDMPPRASFIAIDRETETLSRLIDDLFTLSRLEEGVLPVEATAVDLGQLARDAVSGIRPYALKTARVSVNGDIPEDLPKALGDHTRTTQVVNNLLHNAVRHTPEGGLVMLIVRPDAAREAIRVTIRDTGIGMPPETLARIFDRHYQGESIGAKGGAGHRPEHRQRAGAPAGRPGLGGVKRWGRHGRHVQPPHLAERA